MSEVKERQLKFPDRRRGLQRTVGKTVEFDTEQRRWVSSRIRVYVGPRKAARV